ncbi:hypothetical protein [Palleronia sp. LCG004]|uniref:hypothetical protein n=1 Tax=Palleronia sp. LCG004 TaxID=3079304 RepID=UPI002942149F|nr:hypothetical protein [Palleronia sp. LCG004]WOI58071.1 hypothetical protein RVY76_17165 [Palleronia sp. LCG004]
MWLSMPFIDNNGTLERGDAIWVFGALSLAFGAISLLLASSRQYVLMNLFYAVTDRRAVVCRRGRDAFLRSRLYLVSCLHVWSFTYPIKDARPYPSLAIGSMLSEDAVQPFGLGLTHPGWPMLQSRGINPILFENIREAEIVQDIILRQSEVLDSA